MAAPNGSLEGVWPGRLERCRGLESWHEWDLVREFALGFLRRSGRQSWFP
jgi:hypothetical protein